MKLLVAIIVHVAIFLANASSILAGICELNNTQACPDGEYCKSVACAACNNLPTCVPCYSRPSACEESEYLYWQQGDMQSIQNCFEECVQPDLYCSDEAPDCDDGVRAKNWCGFQAGTSGYCLSCAEWDHSDFAHPYQCGLSTRSEKSRQECLKTCHTGCSSTADCIGESWDSFCAFDTASQGYCSPCDSPRRHNGQPQGCANYFFDAVDDGVNDLTEAECLSTCFRTCTIDSDCGNEMQWNCTEYKGAGYCTPWTDPTSNGSSRVFPIMCSFVVTSVALHSLLESILS